LFGFTLGLIIDFKLFSLLMKTKLLPGKLPAALLTQLIAKLPTKDKNLLIPPGVGLDAAGLKIGNELVAVTTDPITFATDQIAFYSVAVNVNDIACLGCRPRWYSATLLLPVNIKTSMVKQIWEELAYELRRYGITSIGGHVEVTPTVNTPILIGQIIGEVATKNKKLLDARNSLPGDKILLCNGVAIEGTALLAKERARDLVPLLSTVTLKKMRNLLVNPGICIWPSVKKILNISGVVALHDPTEGGIATALHELADAADLGLDVDGAVIPILKETQQLAAIFNFDPLGLLASGSFLIACKPNAVEKIISALGVNKVTEIGEFSQSKAKIIRYGTKKHLLPRYIQDEIVKALKCQI